MNKLVSIVVFSAALFVGVFCLPANTPTIYEKLYPSLSSDEINLLLGKRVINNSGKKNFAGFMYPLGMKYTLDADAKMMAEVGRNGEMGEVVSLQEFMKVKDPAWRKLLKDCNLLVKWDEKNEDGRNMFSCHGRFSSRIFLEFE
ncbi:MAG: hypothetical protein LH614_16440 [Pyrinomonadaceae bacterium]|nr:hypothetical protein [Pyrinomonadaceae bacterium]